MDEEAAVSLATGASVACRPAERHPDWRWRTALRLAHENPHGPVEHDDPWVEQAVEYVQAHNRNPRARPSDQHKAIVEACRFQRKDSIARVLVEAGLLGQQPPAEIAEQWGLADKMVTAFGALFFDVQGTTGWSTWCDAEPIAQSSRGRSRFCHALRRSVRSLGVDALPRTVEILREYDCLADRLPRPGSAEWPGEVRIRVTLAMELLGRSRQTTYLVKKAEQALCEATMADGPSVEGIAMVHEVLSATRIPAEVQYELEQLRPPVATNAEATSASDMG